MNYCGIFCGSQEGSEARDYHIVYLHRNEYPVSVMCKTFGVSKSGYYDFVRRLDRPDTDAGLAQLIREKQKPCQQTYGSRRMWMRLGKQGIHYNPIGRNPPPREVGQYRTAGP